VLSNVQDDSMWPNVTSQKLFYDDHVVVSASADVKGDIGNC